MGDVSDTLRQQAGRGKSCGRGQTKSEITEAVRDTDGANCLGTFQEILRDMNSSDNISKDPR